METRQQHIVEIGFDDDFGDEGEDGGEDDHKAVDAPAPAPRTIAPPPGKGSSKQSFFMNESS